MPPKRKPKPKAPTAKRDPVPETAAEVGDALDGCLALIRKVRALMVDPDLESKVLEKLMARESRLLGLQGQLEIKREFLKDRIVGSHADWARVKSVLLEALKPFPDASLAVIDALKDLGV